MVWCRQCNDQAVGWTAVELGFEYLQQQQKPLSFLLFLDWLRGAPSLLAIEYMSFSPQT